MTLNIERNGGQEITLDSSFFHKLTGFLVHLAKQYHYCVEDHTVPAVRKDWLDELEVSIVYTAIL